MSRAIRFHLDEHVARAVAVGLRRRGMDVTTTADAGLLGAGDADHLTYATAQGRLVFTEDEDFLTLASQGVAHAGIAYSRQNTRSTGEVIAGLELIWKLCEPDEIRNTVQFL